ncbi:unnamed protein product [Ixodes pacificus]
MRTPNFLFKKSPRIIQTRPAKKEQKKTNEFGKNGTCQMHFSQDSEPTVWGEIAPCPSNAEKHKRHSVHKNLKYTCTYKHAYAPCGKRAEELWRGRDDVWYQSLGTWNGEGRLGRQRTYCSRPQSENGRICFSTQSRPEKSKRYRGYKAWAGGKKTEVPFHRSQPASDCNNHNSGDGKTECAIQLRFRFGETRHGSTANMEWVCTFEKCIVARRKNEPLPFADLCVDTL